MSGSAQSNRVAQSDSVAGVIARRGFVGSYKKEGDPAITPMRRRWRPPRRLWPTWIGTHGARVVAPALKTRTKGLSIKASTRFSLARLSESGLHFMGYLFAHACRYWLP